jgi:hypothetical protein
MAGALHGCWQTLIVTSIEMQGCRRSSCNPNSLLHELQVTLMEEMVKEQAAAVMKANHAPPWLQPHADTWCVCNLGSRAALWRC